MQVVELSHNIRGIGENCANGYIPVVDAPETGFARINRDFLNQRRYCLARARHSATIPPAIAVRKKMIRITTTTETPVSQPALVHAAAAVNKTPGRPRLHLDRKAYRAEWMRRLRVEQRADAVRLAQVD
jgi:hypothetical protein